MKLFAKVVIGVFAVVIALLVLAWWQPVTASRVIWPIIEDRMLRDPFVGVTAGNKPVSVRFFKYLPASYECTKYYLPNQLTETRSIYIASESCSA